MNTLRLVRGLPGSGKSTFARRMFPGAFHVEQDMFFVRNGVYRYNPAMIKNAVEWCMSATVFALDAGMDVVVSNTSTLRRYVEAYRAAAEKAGAGFQAYRMLGSFNDVHSVPDDVKRNMAAKFEDWPGEIGVRPVDGGYIYV